MGHAVGDSAQRRADPGPGLDARQILHDQLAVVVGVDAHENRGVAAGQRPRRHTGVFERFPAHFERQPLLRIHQFRFTRGHAEELGVEPGEIVEEGAPPSGFLQHRGVARVPAQIRLPASGRYLADVASAFGQESPELRGVVDAAGQAAADADDRDRFRGSAMSAKPRTHSKSG